MIDQSTEFGARVARHLREEPVVWLTTVTPSGQPLPRPVGFLWSGGNEIAVYSQPGARVRNLRSNPKVALNFRGDVNGTDIVVLAGTAELDERGPSADQNAGWVKKYAAELGSRRDDRSVVRAALQRSGADPDHSGRRVLRRPCRLRERLGFVARRRSLCTGDA